MMQGMSFASLKKHKALIPLYAIVFLGCGGAIGYGLRVALYNPDVAWSKKNRGGLSNEYYRDKQYKLYSPTVDYEKLESPAPKF